MEKTKDLSGSLAIGWCDPGNVDSFFMSSIVSAISNINKIEGIEGLGFVQIVGNQIAKQRSDLLAQFEESGLEWLLWIDSDIMFDVNHIKMLWEAKDAVKRPVVSGIYFITFEPFMSLYRPMPCIFKFKNNEIGNQPVHPLPDPSEDTLIPIDAAGMGFTLMHKSVAKKLREVYGNTTFAIEIGDKHISEDVSFFWKLKELNIPVYAHNLCRLTHIKRFMLDDNYYRMWYEVVEPAREKAEQEKQQGAV